MKTTLFPLLPLSLKKFLLLLTFILLSILITACSSTESESTDKTDEATPPPALTIISAGINERYLDPLPAGTTIDLSSWVETEYTNDSTTDSAENETHELEPLYSWTTDGGRLSDPSAPTTQWTAPTQPGLYRIMFTATGTDNSAIQDDILLIIGETESLLFESSLTLNEDASNRPLMEVVIRNIQQDKLELDVIGTIFGQLYREGIASPRDKLFEFIHYDTFTVKSPSGEELTFSNQGSRRLKKLAGKRESHQEFNIDNLILHTGDNQTVIISYELVSNYELWEGFGGNLNNFRQPFMDKPENFWQTLLEWFILRPRDQNAGAKSYSTLALNLPPGWHYAATYPEIYNNKLDLGSLEYMRWNNEQNWKNYQKSPFILYQEGSFLKKEKEVAGVLIQDVYSRHDADIRNHEANYHFIDFLSSYIGPLPVERVLTAMQSIHVMGGGSLLEHFDAYQRSPYGYAYSAMGQIWASAGADVGHAGIAVEEPHYWCICQPGNDRVYHLPRLWGTVRLWSGTTLGGYITDTGLPVYYGYMALQSYYPDWDLDENVFKPMYIYYLQNVVKPGGREVDAYAVTGHQFHTYYKPALGFYYIDKRIQEATNGTKNLSHAVQYFYSEVMAGRDTVTNWSDNEILWLEALYHTVEEGIDFESIFRGYIYGESYGQKFLDLTAYLDVDLDNIHSYDLTAMAPQSENISFQDQIGMGAVADGTIVSIEPSTLKAGVPTTVTIYIGDENLVSPANSTRLAVELTSSEHLGKALTELNKHFQFNDPNLGEYGKFFEVGHLPVEEVEGGWMATFTLTLPANFLDMYIQAEDHSDYHYRIDIKVEE